MGDRARGALEDVTHVFLDVGGTMLHSDPSAADLFHRILAARGHVMDRERIARLLRTPETIVTLIRPFPAGREGEFFRAMNARAIEHLGVEPDDDMLDEIHAQFSKVVAWKPYPETFAILKDLRKSGFRLGVISNASHDLPEKLRLAGLAEFFDTVTYSFDVGAEKPDVRIFRRAVARANAAEEQCVHVGDSFEADYLGARRAGLHAVLLQREGEPPAPCPWIRSLEGLRKILGSARSRP
ncbi:MAG TPA: HAD-IA family hydrolase [Thermoplasmata archaeon]